MKCAISDFLRKMYISPAHLGERVAENPHPLGWEIVTESSFLIWKEERREEGASGSEARPNEILSFSQIRGKCGCIVAKML